MRYFWFFFLLSLINTADAQHKHPTTFGFKGGLNKSIVNGVDLTGAKTGYIGYELYASLFADTELCRKWKLENEILFSFTDDYHFIEIPVHVKYMLFEKFNILIGPKLDFIVDNDNDYFESGYRFRNFGVSGEIGMQYEISKWLFAEFRFSKGLISQIDDLSLEIFDGKRNTLRLGLGVRF